jgi:hypothetical protein
MRDPIKWNPIAHATVRGSDLRIGLRRFGCTRRSRGNHLFTKINAFLQPIAAGAEQQQSW